MNTANIAKRLQVSTNLAGKAFRAKPNGAADGESKASANAARPVNAPDLQNEVRDVRNEIIDATNAPAKQAQLFEALDGQQMQERQHEEFQQLEEMLSSVKQNPNATPKIQTAPTASAADIKSGKGSATVLPKGVDAVYIPSKNIILVREGLTGKDLRAAVREEMGEWAGQMLIKSGGKLAAGDVGARVASSLDGKKPDVGDFTPKKSDTVTVRYQGQLVQAKAKISTISKADFAKQFNNLSSESKGQISSQIILSEMADQNTIGKLDKVVGNSPNFRTAVANRVFVPIGNSKYGSPLNNGTALLVQLLLRGQPISGKNLLPLLKQGVIVIHPDGKSLVVNTSKMNNQQRARIAKDTFSLLDNKLPYPAAKMGNLDNTPMFPGAKSTHRQSWGGEIAEAIGLKSKSKVKNSETIRGLEKGQLTFNIPNPTNPSAVPKVSETMKLAAYAMDVGSRLGTTHDVGHPMINWNGKSNASGAFLTRLIIGGGKMTLGRLKPLFDKGVLTVSTNGEPLSILNKPEIKLDLSKLSTPAQARMLENLSAMDGPSSALAGNDVHSGQFDEGGRATWKSEIRDGLGLKNPALKQIVANTFGGGKWSQQATISAVKDGQVALKDGKYQAIETSELQTPDPTKIETIPKTGNVTPFLARKDEIKPRFMVMRTALHEVKGRHTDKTSFEYFDEKSYKWVTIIARMNGKNGGTTGFAKEGALAYIPLQNGKPPKIRLANWAYGTEKQPKWTNAHKARHSKFHDWPGGYKGKVDFPKGPDGKMVSDEFYRDNIANANYANTDSGAYPETTRVQTNRGRTGRGQRAKYATVAQNLAPKTYSFGVPTKDPNTGAYTYKFYHTGDSGAGEAAAIAGTGIAIGSEMGGLASSLAVTYPAAAALGPAGVVVAGLATVGGLINYLNTQPGTGITKNSDGAHDWFDGGNIGVDRTTDGFKDYTFDYKIYYSENRKTPKPGELKPPKAQDFQRVLNGTMIDAEGIPGLFRSLGFDKYFPSLSNISAKDASEVLIALNDGKPLDATSLAKLVETKKINMRPNGSWSLSASNLTRFDRAQIVEYIFKSKKSASAKSDFFERLTGQPLDVAENRLLKEFKTTSVSAERMAGIFDQPDLPTKHLFGMAPPANLESMKFAAEGFVKKGKRFINFLTENFANGKVLQTSRKQVERAKEQGFEKAKELHAAAIKSGAVKRGDPWVVNVDVAVDIQFHTGGKHYGTFSPTSQNRGLYRATFAFNPKGKDKYKVINHKLGVIWWRDNSRTLFDPTGKYKGIAKVGNQIRYGAFIDVESGKSTMSVFDGITLNNTFNKANIGAMLRGMLQSYVNSRVPSPAWLTRALERVDDAASTVEEVAFGLPKRIIDAIGTFLGNRADINARGGLGYSVTFDLSKIKEEGNFGDKFAMVVPMMADLFSSYGGTWTEKSQAVALGALAAVAPEAAVVARYKFMLDKIRLGKGAMHYGTLAASLGILGARGFVRTHGLSGWAYVTPRVRLGDESKWQQFFPGNLGVLDETKVTWAKARLPQATVAGGYALGGFDPNRNDFRDTAG